MMNTHRNGFTLVELLVGMVVGSMVLFGAYQAITVQDRSYRATSATVQGQDALRIALGVLESELREATTLGGSDIGGTDILMATADSIQIRAPRKLGFVCSVSPSDKLMDIWTDGELFTPGDELLLFVDNEIDTFADDRWDAALIHNISSTSSTCVTSPTGEADQRILLTSHGLGGVSTGAPVRSFEEVTYGLYSFDDGWGLGRRDDEGVLSYVVGGLAGPGEGLTLTYFNAAGNVTTDAGAVASIQISLSTEPGASSGVYPKTVTSTVYLRNN